MQKPDNYDKTSTGQKFTPFYEGGHKLQILDIVESTTKTGKPMLVIKVDGATDDKQPGYFTKMFQQDTRANKKWPFAATVYIVTEDSQGQCSKPLKAFVTCLENSNKGFKVTWGDQFCPRIRGLKIGGVFGVEEYRNSKGEIKTATKHRWFCFYDDAFEATPPEVKRLNDGGYTPASTPADSNGFMSVPDSIDEELPFI